MNLADNPTFLAVFLGVWFLGVIYLGSVFLLSAVLGGERRRGERKDSFSFPSRDPLDSLRMLKFIFTASAARGESAAVMRTVWLVRVLFFASLTGIIGVMVWTAQLGG